MRTVDYHRWIGKELIEVSVEIQDECRKHGYVFAVLDPKFNTHNIDSEPNRLDVYVDDKDVITRIRLG